MTKEEKFQNYKRKLIGGDINPFGFNVYDLNQEAAEYYLDEQNRIITQIREKSEITDEDVQKVLKIKKKVEEVASYNNISLNASFYSRASVYQDYMNEFKVALALKNNPTIATHFGDDLDNRASIYALEQWAKENGIIDEDKNIIVERVPAGQVKEGIVNVDTGGHKGSNYEGETIVIDGNPEKRIKSAVEEINKTFSIYIPEQILECADALPTKISVLDTRTGMSLQKFASIEKVFEMAEDRALTRELTDEELEKYGLVEAQKEQQKTVDDAKEKIAKYTKVLSNGEKIVVSPEFIKAGSLVAYETGINYYASVDKHKSGTGITMAINAKPGNKLPECVKEYGNSIVKELEKEDGTSGAFIHPNGSMFVVGGPKNPYVKLDITQEEAMEKIGELFTEYSDKSLEQNPLQELKENMEKNEELISKNIKSEVMLSEANDLKRDVQKEVKNLENKKEDKNI